MKRREFITLVAGSTASLAQAWAAHAQQTAKVPIIGFLYPGPRQSAVPRIEAFLGGLRGAGYAAPAQVELLVRTAEGDPSRIAPLIAEIIGRNVDVLVAISLEAVMATKSAALTMPVVAADLVSDPVASGLVSSLARPSGNITGLFLAFPDFASKWLELLQETIPGLRRVAVLWDPGTRQMHLTAIENAARSLNIALDVLEVRTPADFDGAFVSAKERQAKAVLLLASPLFPPHVQQLADLAIREKLPAITLFPDFARAGGLLAYGPNLLDTYRQVGVIVSKVLRGAKPADLPIERPTKFELVLNLRTAKTLGITMPTAILLRADEVIE
jgi:putative ABC transport system substrate-binding protein